VLPWLQLKREEEILLLIKEGRKKESEKWSEKWLVYLYKKIAIGDGLAFLNRKDTNVSTSFLF